MLKSCLTKSVMIWISECIILDMYTVLFDMSSIIGAVTRVKLDFLLFAHWLLR